MDYQDQFFDEQIGDWTYLDTHPFHEGKITHGVPTEQSSSAAVSVAPNKVEEDTKTS
jgi:hypothetical protein